jgi:hypothetical protein
VDKTAQRAVDLIRFPLARFSFSSAGKPGQILFISPRRHLLPDLPTKVGAKGSSFICRACSVGDDLIPALL